MNADHAPVVSQDPSTALFKRWQEVCSRYLPLATANSIWRYSRTPGPDDPGQGWKLHISATVLTASDVLEKVAPLLLNRGTMFKAPTSLQELNKINSGLYYGFSQVGKFITVYPRSDEESVLLAGQLHELTAGTTAPFVPFDMRFRPGSSVYYRYGAFELLEVLSPDGTRTLAMRDPQGSLVPDARDSEAAKPEWVSDPFARLHSPTQTDAVETPLGTTFRAYRALTQRGRGGVYEAVDLSVSPPRLCILKEGRRDGEVGWDGRDGFWRVRNEERVLASLREAGIDSPRVYASFEAGNNYYLVTELIEGETLHDFLRRRRKRLSVIEGIKCGIRLANLLSSIHSAGWAWRDCKPGNIMITKKRELRPLDFEGACPVACPDPMLWGTPAFVPPEHRSGGSVASRVYNDLYALGATLYFILTARLPESPASLPIEKLRRNVPPKVCRLISKLLSADPLQRLPAQTIARRLESSLALARDSKKLEAAGTSPAFVGEGRCRYSQTQASEKMVQVV